MSKLEVAHFARRGEEIVVAVFDESFGLISSLQQYTILERIEKACRLAGLPETVAIVWGNQDQMKFIAPQKWHPFLKCVDLPWIISNYNHLLSL
jgi:hypothetical protein